MKKMFVVLFFILATLLLSMSKNSSKEIKLEELKWGASYEEVLKTRYSKVIKRKRKEKSDELMSIIDTYYKKDDDTFVIEEYMLKDKVNFIKEKNATFNGLKFTEVTLLFCNEYYCGWTGEYKAYDDEEFFNIFMIMGKKAKNEYPFTIEKSKYFFRITFEDENEENAFLLKSNLLKFNYESNRIAYNETDFRITFEIKGKNYFDFDNKKERQMQEVEFEKKQASMRATEEFRRKF